MARNIFNTGQALAKARTESAIAAFENKMSHIIFPSKSQQIDAKLDLITESEKCKKNYQEDLNQGLNISIATEKLAQCANIATGSYESSYSRIQSETEKLRTTLIGELDGTLNNPLYSQDFDAYWQ
jgi:hypothetical protein